MNVSVNTGIYLFVLLVIVFSVQMVSGEKQEDTERIKVFEKVKEILREHDIYKAIEFVNSQGEPQVVAKRYLDLAMDFYWKDKNLPEVINFAQAGIHYCLLKVQEYSRSNPDMAAQLKNTTKALSYNLASFTWPGWDEKGIVITNTDLITGLDAARLNLRLALELEKGPAAVSVSHWVIGAQYLALGDYEKAIESFTAAQEKAREAEDKTSELMNAGYIGIAKILAGKEKDGQKEFDNAQEGLTQQKTEDADFYKEQLQTVLKVLSK